MLAPNATYTAAGRLNAVASIGPTANYVVGGIGFSSAGNIIIDTNAASSPTFDAGMAQSAGGAIYGTTTTAGTDIFQNALRFTSAGVLVYVQADPVRVVNGNPLDANGALCIA